MKPCNIKFLRSNQSKNRWLLNCHHRIRINKNLDQPWTNLSSQRSNLWPQQNRSSSPFQISSNPHRVRKHLNNLHSKIKMQKWMSKRLSLLILSSTQAKESILACSRVSSRNSWIWWCHCYRSSTKSPRSAPQSHPTSSRKSKMTSPSSSKKQRSWPVSWNRSTNCVVRWSPAIVSQRKIIWSSKPSLPRTNASENREIRRQNKCSRTLINSFWSITSNLKSVEGCSLA